MGNTTVATAPSQIFTNFCDNVTAPFISNIPYVSEGKLKMMNKVECDARLFQDAWNAGMEFHQHYGRNPNDVEHSQLVHYVEFKRQREVVDFVSRVLPLHALMFLKDRMYVGEERARQQSVLDCCLFDCCYCDRKHKETACRKMFYGGYIPQYYPLEGGIVPYRYYLTYHMLQDSMRNRPAYSLCLTSQEVKQIECETSYEATILTDLDRFVESRNQARAIRFMLMFARGIVTDFLDGVCYDFDSECRCGRCTFCRADEHIMDVEEDDRLYRSSFMEGSYNPYGNGQTVSPFVIEIERYLKGVVPSFDGEVDDNVLDGVYSSDFFQVLNTHRAWSNNVERKLEKSGVLRTNVVSRFEGETRKDKKKRMVRRDASQVMVSESHSETYRLAFVNFLRLMEKLHAFGKYEARDAVVNLIYGLRGYELKNFQSKHCSKFGDRQSLRTSALGGFLKYYKLFVSLYGSVALIKCKFTRLISMALHLNGILYSKQYKMQTVASEQKCIRKIVKKTFQPKEKKAVAQVGEELIMGMLSGLIGKVNDDPVIRQQVSDAVKGVVHDVSSDEDVKKSLSAAVVDSVSSIPLLLKQKFTDLLGADMTYVISSLGSFLKDVYDMLTQFSNGFLGALGIESPYVRVALRFLLVFVTIWNLKKLGEIVMHYVRIAATALFESVCPWIDYRFWLGWDLLFTEKASAQIITNASIMLSALSSLVLYCASSGTVFQTCDRIFSFAGRAGSIMEAAMTYSGDILDWVALKICGKHLFSSREDMQTVNETLDEFRDFLLTKDLARLVVVDPVYTKRTIALYDKIVMVQGRILFNSGIPPPVKSHFSVMLSKLTELKKVADSMSYMMQSRVTPVCMCFRGPPGQGKTTWLEILFTALWQRMHNRYPDEFTQEDFTKALLHIRDTASDYWEGYNHQPFTVYNEIMETIDLKDRAKTASEILKMCEDAPYSLNMAFGDKGSKFFTSPFVAITTNFNDVNAIGLTDAGAFVRRINFPLYVTRVGDLDMSTPERILETMDQAWSFEARMFDVNEKQNKGIKKKFVQQTVDGSSSQQFEKEANLGKFPGLEWNKKYTARQVIDMCFQAFVLNREKPKLSVESSKIDWVGVFGDERKEVSEEQPQPSFVESVMETFWAKATESSSLGEAADAQVFGRLKERLSNWLYGMALYDGENASISSPKEENFVVQANEGVYTVCDNDLEGLNDYCRLGATNEMKEWPILEERMQDFSADLFDIYCLSLCRGNTLAYRDMYFESCTGGKHVDDVVGGIMRLLYTADRKMVNKIRDWLSKLLSSKDNACHDGLQEELFFLFSLISYECNQSFLDFVSILYYDPKCLEAPYGLQAFFDAVYHLGPNGPNPDLFSRQKLARQPYVMKQGDDHTLFKNPETSRHLIHFKTEYGWTDFTAWMKYIPKKSWFADVAVRSHPASGTILGMLEKIIITHVLSSELRSRHEEMRVTSFEQSWLETREAANTHGRKIHLWMQRQVTTIKDSLDDFSDSLIEHYHNNKYHYFWLLAGAGVCAVTSAAFIACLKFWTNMVPCAATVQHGTKEWKQYLLEEQYARYKKKGNIKINLDDEASCQSLGKGHIARMKKLRGKTSRPGIAKAQTLGAFTDRLGKVAKNIARVKLYFSRGYTVSVFVLCVTSTVLATVAHALIDRGTLYKIELFFDSSSTENCIAIHEGQFETKDFLSEGRDLALIVVDHRIMQARPDLSKYLPSRNDALPSDNVIRMLKKPTGGLTTIYVKEGRGFVHKTRKLEATVDDLNDKQEIQHISVFHRDYYLHLNGEGGDGQCGLPYVCTTPQVQSYVLCIHGAQIGEDAVAVPIYKEDIVEFLAANAQCAGIPYEMVFPEYVEGSEGQKIFVEHLPISHGAVPVGMTYYGSLTKPRIMPEITQFEPTVFQTSDLGPLYPVNMAPAVLTRFKGKDGKLTTPLKQNFIDKTSDSCSPGLPPWLFNMIMEDPIKFVQGYCPVPDIKFRKLSEDEAAFGSTALGIQSLDDDTAAGVLLFMHMLKRKDIFNVQERYLCKKIRRILRMQEKLAAQGKYTEHMVGACAKDELRDLLRVLLGKTRIFFIGDFLNLMRVKMHLGHLIAYLKQHRAQTSCAVGINPHGNEWEFLWTHLNNRHTEGKLGFSAGDISGYDMGLIWFLCWMFFEWVNMFYKYEEDTDLWHQLRAVCYSIVAVIYVTVWDLLKSWKGNASGNWATGFFNSFCNWVMHKMIFCWSCRLLGVFYHFEELVHFVCYGDDSANTVLQCYEEVWNMHVIRDGFKTLFGMTYTDPSKGEITSKFMQPEDVVFLCRRFVLSANGRHVLAPLELDSIHGMLLWTRRSELGAKVQLETNIKVASMEMYHHGEEAWMVFASHLKKYCSYHDIKWTGKTYTYWHNRYITQNLPGFDQVAGELCDF